MAELLPSVHVTLGIKTHTSHSDRYWLCTFLFMENTASFDYTSCSLILGFFQVPSSFLFLFWETGTREVMDLHEDSITIDSTV